jgi:tetratricopeptide (TPR) repeat protein
MNRQLNTKLLAWIVIPTCVIAAGAFFLRKFWIEHNAEKIYNQAQMAQTDIDAVKYLERYLALRSSKQDTYFQALARYGYLLDKNADSGPIRQQAISALQKALRQDPDSRLKLDPQDPSKDVNVRALLTQSFVESGLYEQALPHLDRLIGLSSYGIPIVDPATTDPKNTTYLLQRGQALLELKRYFEADTDLEYTILLDPTSIDAYFYRALLLRQNLGRKEQGDALIDEAVAQNPGSGRAYLARAVYRAQFKKSETDSIEAKKLEDGALADARKAIELDPDDLRAIRVAAYLELENSAPKIDSARALLERGIEKSPKTPDLYLLLSAAELQDKQPQKAEDVLMRGIKELPQSLDLSWKLANLLIDSGKFERARELIDHFGKTELPSPLLGLLKGRLLAAQGQWEDAVKALDEITGIRPQLESRQQGQNWSQFAVQADLTLARCYEQIYKQQTTRTELPGKALSALRRAVQTDPDSVPAQLALAALLANRDEHSEAMQILQRVKTTSLEGLVLRARMGIASEMRRESDRRDWKPIEALIDEIEGVVPKSVEVAVLRANLDLAKNQKEEARKRLEAARSEHPKSLEIWIALAELDRLTGRINEAAQTLDQVERQLGDSPELFMARVAFWSRQNSSQAREALINLAPRIAQYPAERQATLAMATAQALTRVGANAKATELWKSLATKYPDNLDIQIGLFDQAVRTNDDAAMRQCVEDIKHIEGEEKGVLWRYAEAGRHVAQARGDDTKLDLLKTARDLLNQVENLRRGWSRIPLMRAEIAEIEKDPDSAIRLYEEAIRGGERRVSVIRRLVQLLYEQKNYVEADKRIRELLALDPAGVQDLKRLATEISVQLKDKDHALAVAGEAIPPDSTDYRDHVWLGQVYLALGEVAAAEKAFRKAVEVARNIPEPWITLVQFLIRAQRPDEAETTLTQASQALSPTQGALILARGYEFLGRADKADELFQKAIAVNPDDIEILRAAASYFLGQRRVNEAEPVLRKIIATATADTQKTDRTWARRILALALMNVNTPANVARASELIQANERDNPGAPEDLVAQALILTPQPDKRPEAIDLFEKAEKAGPLDGSRQLILARLYESTKNWPKARELMLKVIGDNPAQPAYMVAFIHALVRNKEFDATSPWIEQLEKLEPGSLRTLSLRASILQSQQKDTEAIALLRKYVSEHPEYASRIALILEGLNYLEAAELTLAQAIRQNPTPETVLNLAAFHSRTNKLKEALDLCESVRKNIAPEMLIPRAIQIISTGAASDEDFQRVERWIEDAEKTADQTNLVIRNMRGILRTVQGQFQEAEALYRKSLETDPKDYMALNNLAWLLALTGSNPNEALTMINRAIEVVGPHPPLLDTRAVVHIARHDPKSAINDLENAIGSQPEAAMYFHLARAHQADNNPDAARVALKKAEDMGLTPAEIDSLERDAYTQLKNHLAELVEPEPEP